VVTTLVLTRSPGDVSSQECAGRNTTKVLLMASRHMRSTFVDAAPCLYPSAMHLYDSTVPSGNAYKVHLLLSQLGSPYTVTSLHIFPPHSEAHQPEFLAINPNGKVPALRLDDGTVLTESNAILSYLTEGT
jgi:hypothetical protein